MEGCDAEAVDGRLSGKRISGADVRARGVCVGGGSGAGGAAGGPVGPVGSEDWGDAAVDAGKPGDGGGEVMFGWFRRKPRWGRTGRLEDLEVLDEPEVQE